MKLNDEYQGEYADDDMMPHEDCADCRERFELLTFSPHRVCVGWSCPQCGGTVTFEKDGDPPPSGRALLAGAWIWLCLTAVVVAWLWK